MRFSREKLQQTKVRTGNVSLNQAGPNSNRPITIFQQKVFSSLVLCQRLALENHIVSSARARSLPPAPTPLS
ncbi:hypothetical protein ACTXT7_006127 [Hymenolepis weldensis]